MALQPTPPLRVLIVDDDPATRRSLQELLNNAGYTAVVAGCAADARRATESEEPALAVLDLVLPDGDGVALLADLRTAWPAMPAIIVTGYVETRSIVEAMRRGAIDYLAKPVDPDVFLSVCRTALARRAALTAAVPAEPLPIVGEGVVTARIRESVQRLARSRPAGALFVGDHGVGKTWLATALHAASARRTAPCLPYSCGTAFEPAVALLGIPGSTTGGLLAAAQGGSVVLDNVDRLDPDVQMQVLHWVEGLRGGAPLIVGLTTRPSEQSPLLAWLGRATIAVPPLAERSSDVLPLARHFLTEAASRNGRHFEGFSRAAEHQLLGHTWPGNVRELRDTIEHAVQAAAGGVIQPDHLRVATATTAVPVWAPTGEPRPLREIEEAYIDHVLAHSGGNKTRAARILGVARETLRTRMLTRKCAG